MPIDFKCSHCGKLLRTGDETAGKKAKCPDCGTVLTIPIAGAAAPSGPTPGAVPPPRPPLGPPPQAAAANPYQSPTVPPVGAGAAGPIGRAVLDMNDVFSRTWEIFKSQLGTCILIPLVASLLYGVVIAVALMILFGIAAVLGHIAGILSFLVMFFGIIALWVAVMAMVMPLVRIFLKIARGQPVAFGDIFDFGPQIIPFVLTQLLFGIMVEIGCMLCLVPGILLAVMFFPCTWLVLDRNLGVMDSFNEAKEITNGNKMTLFVLWLLAGLGAGLVNALTCGLGGLVTGPFMGLMSAVAYLRMTGQPLANVGPVVPPQV